MKWQLKTQNSPPIYIPCATHYYNGNGDDVDNNGIFFKLVLLDAPKESHEKLIKGSYEDPADCKSCFEDCYLPGDEKEQIDACSEECKC